MSPITFLTSLNYLSDTTLYKTAKPYEVWLDEVPKGLQPTNVAFKLYHDRPIHDVREIGIDHFSIEEHGFEFHEQKFPESCPVSASEDDIPTEKQRKAVLEYIDVMNDFLCEKLGGEKAVCFDFRVGVHTSLLCGWFSKYRA